MWLPARATSVGRVTRTDDEDWLYRRGRYADGSGERRQDGVPPPMPPPPPPASADTTRYGAPTPVGHYGAPRSAPPPGAPRTPHPQGPPQAPPPQARPPQRPVPPPPAPVARPRRRRPVVRWLVALVLAYLLGIPLLTWPFMPRVDATPSGDRPADTPGYVFVLAGSDSREGLSKEEQDRLGTGSDAGRRTDTIMLLYVPPTGRAALISVPRDSYVAIPGHGKNKINASYALGGPELLVETVEQNTGLHVDGFAEIGFGGFAGVVDAVGGIEMCPEKAIKDPQANLDIQGGCQLMDGPTALGYVRMRKQDPRGDIGRAERQREMVGALAKKALSPMTILLPPRWFGLNWSLSRGITVGEGTGPGEFFGLAQGGLRIATGRGDTLVVPVGDTGAQTAAGSSVLWDTKKAEAMFAAMARGEGDLSAYA